MTASVEGIEAALIDTVCAGPAERTLDVLEDIRTSGSYDLTTLPVARREVRDLIRAGTAQPSPPPVPQPTAA
jgi:hypothetical protein